MAREFGLDPKPQAALEAMYQQLHRAFKINGALGSFFHATNGVLQGCAMSVLMINMLTTVWMRAVDELEGAITVTVHSLPPIPPKLEEPKELRYRRKPSPSTAVSRLRPPQAPSRCVMKTFGSGIDQFEYWEHSNPCTCGHGPPPPPQQSQPPHPSSEPEPERDGLVEEEMAASGESPPHSPVKLRGAQPQPQEAGTIQVGSIGYADDTYPLRSEGQYMAPVMQLTDEWLALTLQKVNPKKSLSIQVRQSKEIARKHTVLQGISLPLQAEFRSLGVGIRTSLTRGTGPLLKKRTSKGIHLLSRVRGAQGGFSRRTHIIATLVQAAALWGTPGAEVSRRDLQSLETAVLHSLWGTSRPGRAKEIIFVLLVQGHRVSPHMKTTYDRVCWLLAVARTPGTLQVVVQSCIEARQAQVRPTTSGPVQRALLELESLGWRQADHWWVWNVPGVPEEIDMTLINEDKFKHILRDSIRRRALLSLEDRRPRQFQGILGALDREACQVLLSEGTEFDKALLRGWLTGALWTAARAHARGLRATPLCPYCSRQQEEDDEHILWACPAWGIHRSGAWRSLMRTARALGLSDQISSWPTCLRICGLMPEHLSHGIPKGQVHEFMYGFHSMVLQILRARAHREDVQLFDQPKTKQGRGYPFWQFIGPLPRPEHREKLRIRQPTAQEWRWDSDFRDDLLRWVNELVWIPGKGQVSFMELAMDFECFAARTLPASPQAVYRATALPLPERARVLKLALATLQKLSVAGAVLPGGVLTKCSSLVPLGAPTVVGVSARPYFTRRLDMLKLLQNLQEYCELRWTAVLQAPPPSPDTRRRNAQRAKERREAMESSPSIRERIPKLKYTSSLLPAMHTPRHLTGRGGGKKSTTLFAADYFPAHRNPGAPPTRPYRLLRPAKQAVPPPPDVAAVGSSPQAALPAGRAAAPSGLSQRVDALTLPDAPLGWAPPSPSPPVQLEYTSEEGPSTPEVFSSSSSWESEPINTGGSYRRATAGPRSGPARSSPPHAVPRTRAPRARSVHRSRNPALRKSRRRAPPARVPRGVKRRQSVTAQPGSPRRKRPQLQQGDARSHTALEAPDRHGSPAGAPPLPMSRHALSYLQLTGAITPERASRIVVVSTPEGQRTPLPTRSSEQPPHEKGRDIPPGIARMLQQIRMPSARPQPLQPRREPRPSERTSRTAVLPPGPPMGFNVTSTPSPRVLSRPGQFSPSPAWSPAVTSSWHSVRHVTPEHWSPACTPAGGSNRQQDSPHLPPVLLAPLFESAMSTPRRDSTQSASDEDVQQYAVRCSTPPDLPPTLLAPLFESVMSASRAGSTHRECDEDMGQYEVQYSTPPSVGEWPPNPFTFPSLRGAQRLCTELPGMARQSQGWVRDPHARHSTMLYSMQEGALSSNSAEGLMKHGRASREAT